MNYAWVDANLNNPRTQLDNPLFEHIQIAHGLAVRDDLVLGALSAAIYLFNGSFLPNDGINLVADGVFTDVTSRSRFLGRTPTISHFDGNHFSVQDHEGALAYLAALVSGSQRATVTVERAKVSNLHETFSLFQTTEAEILFESTATSPWVETAWGITDPVSELGRNSGVPPLWKYKSTNTWQTLDHVVFDDMVRDEETVLHLEVTASEIDWEAKYGMFEFTTNILTGATAMGTAAIDLNLAQPGRYTLKGPQWEITLRVDIANYPIGRSLYLPDEADTGAGTVSVAGEAQDLDLAAGPSLAGKSYVILGSVSGTVPGLRLRGGTILPINPDTYTRLVLASVERSRLPPLAESWGFRRTDLAFARDVGLHQGFAGVLDATGRASATFNPTAAPLSTALVGMSLSYAAAIFDPHTGVVLDVTNPVSVLLVP